MKTSKIILISFSSFIGLLLLSFFIVGITFNDAARRERNAIFIANKKREKTIKIENHFKHIFIKNKSFILIKHGEEQLLEHYTNENSLNKPIFEVKNDTLFLGFQSNIRTKLTLKDVNNLKSISGVNASVTLSGLEMPTLNLYFNGGKVDLTDNTKVKNINVTLSEKSRLNIHNNVVVDTLNLDINNSKINFWNTKRKIPYLKGTINNKSDVRIPKALHINLDIDESSKLRMW